MAQIAEKLNRAQERRITGQVVPMRGAQGTSAIREAQIPGRVQSSMPGRLRDAKERAGDALISTKQSVAKVYRNAQEHIADSFPHLVSVSRDVRNRAEQMKREHPLQLLAVITGAAFALGIAARIWRSRRHA